MYNIIAIERQYASGGRKIGELLAKKLNMSFYNEEILNMAARKLNVSPDNVEHLEEIAANNLMQALEMLAYNGTNQQFNNKLFYAESEIINGLAFNGNCIIVGRCASSILSDNKNCLKIFIYADEGTRIKRAIEEYGIPEKEVQSILAKNDKRRTEFYHMRSEKKWLSMNTYDICLNSGKLGIERCVEILESAINAK